MAHVFISYSSKDVAVAEELQKRLEARGITVWRDKERLDLEATGRPYTPAIRSALDKAEKVVVLWSPRSVASTWVQQEAQAANKAKKIVPLLIEACELPFPHALNHTIRIDGLAAQIDVIARAIGADIPGGGLVTPPDAIRYRLPTSGKAEELIGRSAELTKLFTAWDFGETKVFVLDAMGGTGKTALVNALVQGLETTGWRGAEALYTWSFYSQGAREESNISSDEFMNEALDWFGYAGRKPKADMKSWEKGEALAKLIAARRTLLILDGIEPLQYPAHSPGLAGQIKQNDGLKELLDYLALHSKGLTVVTTRVPVVDLASNPEPRVLRPQLQPLSTSAGVQLLRKLGVKGEQQELEHTVSGHADPAHGWPEGFSGHALSLTLLGTYLAAVYNGDIRQRDKVPGLFGADREQGGHAFRVMKAYEDHFESRISEQVARGEKRERTGSARQLAILHMMGLFDRPAGSKVVAFLRQSRIPGLTEPLADLTEGEWKLAVDGLRKLGLLNKPHAGEDGTEIDDGSLDAHPLVREYFEMRLKERGGGVYEAAHGELYDYYRYMGLPEALKTPVAYALVADEVAYPEYGAKRTVDDLISGRMSAKNIANTAPALVQAGYDELRAAAKLIGADDFERAKRAFAPQLGRDGTAGEILVRLGACFSAIAHGCKAGRYTEAFQAVYVPRVARGNEQFAAHKLGAHGANLAALAQFFAEPFAKPAGRSDARPGGLSEGRQALVLNLAGFPLRAQGRLADAVAPFRGNLQMRVEQKVWESAARAGGNLSGLLLTLGRVAEASAAGKAAVAHAKRFAGERQDIEDAKFMPIVAAATHAHALAAAGRLAEAGALLDEAEAQQAERQPSLPLLTSMGSAWLCDLRLDQGRAREVLARVEYGLPHTTSLVDTALATLALGRAHAALAAAPSPRSSWGEGRPRRPRRPPPRRRRRQAA